MSEFQPTVAYTLTPEHLASERVEVSMSGAMIMYPL